MWTLRSVLEWADTALNGAVLGSLGGVFVAHGCDAVQAQGGLCFWLVVLSLSAFVAAVQIDF